MTDYLPAIACDARTKHMSPRLFAHHDEICSRTTDRFFR